MKTDNHFFAIFLSSSPEFGALSSRPCLNKIHRCENARRLAKRSIFPTISLSSTFGIGNGIISFPVTALNRVLFKADFLNRSDGLSR